MMVGELTFRLFLTECLAVLLGTIVPKEKGDIHGFASPGTMHC
jgi:hypothetical protein